VEAGSIVVCVAFCAEAVVRAVFALWAVRLSRRVRALEDASAERSRSLSVVERYAKGLDDLRREFAAEREGSHTVEGRARVPAPRSVSHWPTHQEANAPTRLGSTESTQPRIKRAAIGFAISRET